MARQEVEVLFRGMAGLMTRQQAREAVAKLLKVDVEMVYPIRLATEAGKRDIKGIFYIYNDVEEAKRQLHPYIFERLKGKEEGEAS